VEITAFETKEFLERRLSDSGQSLEGLDATAAFEEMAGFYEVVRISDVTIEDDGDLLLYQWGTRNWGEGPAFEVDLTRQLAVDWDVDDDALFQLSLTLRYDPAVGDSVGNGYVWCYLPEHLASFRGSVQESAAFRRVSGLQANTVTLRFEPAG